MKKIAIAIMVVFGHFAIGQNLENRWNKLLNESNNYKAYKIIQEAELDRIWLIMQDSMLHARASINLERKRVKDQQLEITTLKKKASEMKSILSLESREKNKILRSQASSSEYIIGLWITIAVVVVIGFLLFVLYKRSNDLTLSKEKENAELRKLFDEYKSNKMEVERKLKREIQDYMNKLEEYKEAHFSPQKSA